MPVAGVPEVGRRAGSDARGRRCGWASVGPVRIGGPSNARPAETSMGASGVLAKRRAKATGRRRGYWPGDWREVVGDEGRRRPVAHPKSGASTPASQ